MLKNTLELVQNKAHSVIIARFTDPQQQVRVWDLWRLPSFLLFSPTMEVIFFPISFPLPACPPHFPM